MEESAKELYFVTMVPNKKIPDENWDAALASVQLYVNAESAEEAEKIAVEVLESRGLCMTPSYIHEWSLPFGKDSKGEVISDC